MATSFQAVQLIQSIQNDLLRRFLNLAGEEDLIEDGVYLEEVKDEVQLAHVAEVGIQDLDKQVNGLEVEQLVVGLVNARAEEKPRVPPVDDLRALELDKVRLELLVPRGY